MSDVFFKTYRRLFAKVDISFLVYFRIAFGLIMFWEVVRYFSHGWISRYWIDPIVNFSYFGFSWVKPWPGIGMYIHMGVLGLLALSIALGWHYRKCSILFFLGFTYTFLLEQARYLNHFYLIILMSFLMIFLPANQSFSLDVKRDPTLHRDKISAWVLWLLRFQIGIPYFYGGIAKITPDWLHGEPLRMWIGHKLDSIWSPLLLSYGGLFLDLFIVPALLYKKTRVLAFIMALSFHLGNAWLFNIGIFPWFMIVATTLFFSPSWPRKVFSGMKKTTSIEVSKSKIPTHKKKIIVLALAVYVCFQLLTPFRHLLYPGLVHWTEEGHLFAWHMKLRDKDAEGKFLIKDPKTQETWNVNPRDILAKWQSRKMMTRPDIIIQFAHFLADKKKKEGVPGVEVYAHIWASLNGRKFSPLIDPKVNLVNVSRTFGPANWILPLEQKNLYSE